MSTSDTTAPETSADLTTAVEDPPASPAPEAAAPVGVADIGEAPSGEVEARQAEAGSTLPESGPSGEPVSPRASTPPDPAEPDSSATDSGASLSIASTLPEGHPLDAAQQVLECLRSRIRAQVIGRDEVIDLVLVALLADGHVLLEDFPGSGKTTLAKSLGTSIVDPRSPDGDPDSEQAAIAAFRRIQFTPDLLPSDVTGVSIFDATRHRFQFRQGPIFAHVVLADEINRTSPKVQSAMLEAMAEKQVTVDNVTFPLDELFFVIATQNPLDLAGTYPLPVAQLDRFLFKIRMDHIDRASELQVLETWRDRRDTERADLPKVSRDQVLDARRAIDAYVTIDARVKESLVDIAEHVRSDDRVAQGCSTRSLVLMLPALQALAVLEGRDYVSADDIVTLVPRVRGHRVELAPGLSDVGEVLDDALAHSIEGLSRSTLRRR
ncbi:MAG: AAA family ATPase, partial [Holophagales bacterium]|nr:AAA family ATPase [Holophagales bacterium]